MAADWAFKATCPLFKDGGPSSWPKISTSRATSSTTRNCSSGCPSCRRAASNRAGSSSRRAGLYERDGVFPASVIDYVARMLEEENDEFMNQKLVATCRPTTGSIETRKIMHKDLHQH